MFDKYNLHMYVYMDQISCSIHVYVYVYTLLCVVIGECLMFKHIRAIQCCCLGVTQNRRARKSPQRPPAVFSCQYEYKIFI